MAVIGLALMAPGAAFPGDDARERRLATEQAATSALEAEAAALFKAKRYREACAVYQKIAAAHPDSGAPQADLGLCLQRLGKKKEAIAANWKAIALGAKTDVVAAGEPSTRRHAYFNLYKLGVRAGVPKKGCRKLPAAPGCQFTFWACAGKDNSAGSGMETISTFVRIGLSRDLATIDKGDEMERYNDWPVPDDRRDHVDISIEEETTSICRDSDGPQCGENDGMSTCEVVSADACLGLIGTVCPGADKKENGSAGAAIEEIRVRASR
jgi:hypothetical protein